MMATSANKNKKKAILESLDRRDLEIISLILDGCNNRQIAKRLQLAHQTIKNRTSLLYKKIGLSNGRSDLILWLFSHDFKNPADVSPWLEQRVEGGDT